MCMVSAGKVSEIQDNRDDNDSFREVLEVALIKHDL